MIKTGIGLGLGERGWVGDGSERHRLRIMTEKGFNQGVWLAKVK